MTERYGDWIEIYGGEKFYPLDPRPEELKLETITHGLSMMCRFNGQCKRFFSVAQHSINVVREVAFLTRNWDRKSALKAQLLAALHDASECLGISDICAPAKRYMPEYRSIEEKIQYVVWEAFGLIHSNEEYEIIDRVDKAMSAFEARELMECKHWDLSYSYLINYSPKEKPFIDLSIRDMAEVKKEFHDLIVELMFQYQQEK